MQCVTASIDKQALIEKVKERIAQFQDGAQTTQK